ncbi:MAG: hypothetical protein K2I48_07060, partial [Muribaculaceae bacterium]|nr:hypothetical protein [Muribaculaceae bacterium]
MISIENTLQTAASAFDLFLLLILKNRVDNKNARKIVITYGPSIEKGLEKSSRFFEPFHCFFADFASGESKNFGKTLKNELGGGKNRRKTGLKAKKSRTKSRKKHG